MFAFPDCGGDCDSPGLCPGTHRKPSSRVIVAMSTWPPIPRVGASEFDIDPDQCISEPHSLSKRDSVELISVPEFKIRIQGVFAARDCPGNLSEQAPRREQEESSSVGQHGFQQLIVAIGENGERPRSVNVQDPVPAENL